MGQIQRWRFVFCHGGSVGGNIIYWRLRMETIFGKTVGKGGFGGWVEGHETIVGTLANSDIDAIQHHFVEERVRAPT